MTGGEKTILEDLHILLGVSGAIAAYKAVEVAGRLTAAGAKVNTVMTANACRLVGPKSFEAVTGGAVFTSLWSNCSEYKIGHINLAEWADIVVVAPATANIISKISNGICDDLLSTTLCACRRKRAVLAPAMNTRMWENPAVQRNVEVVKEMGFELTGPCQGRLACGQEGMGRMAEPAEIVKAVERIACEIRNKKR